MPLPYGSSHPESEAEALHAGTLPAFVVGMTQRKPTSIVSRRRFLIGTEAVSLSLLVSACVPTASPRLSPASGQPASQRMQPTPTTSKPTIVLVHGAFAESSSWNGVVAQLMAKEYPVVAVANPLRGVKNDAAYVASIVASIKGAVVLVGHSYGGTVITNAVGDATNVDALVFVSAFAPAEGESSSELAAKFPGATLGEALAAPRGLPGGGKDLYISQDKFHAQFAADVPEETAKLLAATQRPIVESSLTERSGPPAWKKIPSWFVWGDLDKNIPAAAQAFMAERAGSKENVVVSGGSHVVMISRPDLVASLIMRASTR